MLTLDERARGWRVMTPDLAEDIDPEMWCRLRFRNGHETPLQRYRDQPTGEVIAVNFRVRNLTPIRR